MEKEISSYLLSQICL